MLTCEREENDFPRVPHDNLQRNNHRIKGTHFFLTATSITFSFGGRDDPVRIGFVLYCGGGGAVAGGMVRRPWYQTYALTLSSYLGFFLWPNSQCGHLRLIIITNFYFVCRSVALKTNLIGTPQIKPTLPPNKEPLPNKVPWGTILPTK